GYAPRHAQDDGWWGQGDGRATDRSRYGRRPDPFTWRAFVTPAPVTFYREADADPHALDGARVCVVGYGNLGASMALNLRDAGLTVIIGNVDDDYRRHAAADGFDARPIADAVRDADIVYVLIADETMPGCYHEDIAPQLRPGAA